MIGANGVQPSREFGETTMDMPTHKAAEPAIERTDGGCQNDRSLRKVKPIHTPGGCGSWH